MQKKYEYQGETFSIEDTDNCEIKVSDGFNVLSITPNSGGPSVYRVSTVKGGWWWHTNTVEESIDRACRDLIESRKDVTSEEACKALHEYVRGLDVG